MCSWHTWLCSRLRSSAVGTKPAWLTRNTAVPGTRVASANSSGSAVDGTARARSSCRSFARPSRQVMKPANMIAASVSGTQPPCAIFVTLPARNERSTTRNRPNTSTTRDSGHSHRVRATTAPSRVVMIIAPITDAPYAADSALDDPNATTKPTTARNMIALAAGT